jgi:hypothetical protein
MYRLLALVLLHCVAARPLQDVSERVWDAARAIALAADAKSGSTSAVERLESTAPWAPVEVSVEHPTDGAGRETSDVYTIRVHFSAEEQALCDAMARDDACAYELWYAEQNGMNVSSVLCEGGHSLIEVAVRTAHGGCVASLLRMGVDPTPLLPILFDKAAFACDSWSILELLLHTKTLDLNFDSYVEQVQSRWKEFECGI